MSEQNSESIVNPISASESSSSLSPREFIYKYLKYLPWIVIFGIIGLALAYIKLRYIVPIYRVQSALLIKNEQDQMTSKDQRFDAMMMQQESVNLSNESAILVSRPVLERVVRDLNLQISYYNQGNLRSTLLYPEYPVELAISQIADSTRGFGFLVTVLNDNEFILNEDTKKYTFGVPFSYFGNTCTLIRNKDMNLQLYSKPKFTIAWSPVQQAAEGLIGSLRVYQANEQATILTLTFDGESSVLGTDVLNTLMKVYDTLIIEDKRRITINTEQFINERLVNLKSDLGDIEGRLKSNMEQNQTFDVEEQSKRYLDNIAEANKMVVEQNVKLKIVDLLYDYVGNKENTDKLVPANLGIEEPVLAQLVLDYNRLQITKDDQLRTTTRNNSIIKGLENNIEKVRKDIREALSNIRNAYKLSLSTLENEESNAKGQLRTLPGKSMQMLNIQRQQKILEDLYSFLLQKKIETSISGAGTISNSKVLEPALANPNPISPDRKKIYTLYVMIGLLIPTGIFFLIEVLKDKVSGRAEVEKKTNAPILGEVGHSDEEQSSLVVTKNSRSIIAEQFRIIRTNLQYIIGSEKKANILVTSSFSGEGKSFISTNMGAVMALSGRKTVIMEFDIRKPKIVSGLDLKRKMGITNYIIGKASFQDLLIKVEGMDNLYVIPCGPIPPNPAELLLDPRLDELMAEVRANFEIVIMDTAPVGLVSDSLSLRKYATCTMYVIRQGYTFRKQLMMIDDLYVTKKLPSLSLLLNDVTSAGGYYGGYGYYGKNYGYGAGSSYFDEDSSKGGKKNLWKRLKQQWENLFK